MSPLIVQVYKRFINLGMKLSPGHEVQEWELKYKETQLSHLGWTKLSSTELARGWERVM